MEIVSETKRFPVKLRPLFGGLMDTRVKPRISDEERSQRRRGIAVARGSVRLEGFVISPGAEAIAERYIDGELDIDEYIAAVKALG